MKTKYKVIFACIITCIATVFATVYVMNHGIGGFLYDSEQIVCKGNAEPDDFGCCPGETYTAIDDDQGFACCPDSGGDCFPPISK